MNYPEIKIRSIDRSIDFRYGLPRLVGSTAFDASYDVDIYPESSHGGDVADASGGCT